jgi:hypothetical protein
LSKLCNRGSGRTASNIHDQPNWEVIKATKATPDSAADHALFVLGTMTSDRDRITYERIYRNAVQSDTHKVVLSDQLCLIQTMAATLRNRCRIRANFSNVYTDSAHFKAMEEWCHDEFDRRMDGAGINDNSTRAEKKAIRDAFDKDADVHAYVRRMKEIFKSAMKDFRNLP